MMETKLWIALCAILVIHLGSATPDNHTAALSSSKPDPVLDSVPSSTAHSLRIPETDPGSNATGSLNSSTTNASITITPEPRKSNVITSASDANSTKFENSTHSTLSASQSRPTTPVPTHTSTTHMNQTPSFLSTSVTQNHNVLQPQTIAHKSSEATALPDSSTPTSEPLKAVSTTVTPITTIKSTTIKSTTIKSSTSSTSSPQNLTTSQLTTNASQSNRQSTTTQPHSQANPHTKNLLPLNSGDTTTVRDSPALDPLLAGLVSAFIIAAVIITLLLFLKLRRRGNRPEFRRLQELPMDDMEDTPLSMYSY